GYGMPSYTLLGRTVIKLPFIVYTSLGHEIAHNWWGNSVYVDYEGGNWCEGLTTYLADYHYKELESHESATQYRKEILQDYTNYVNPANDFPLTDFTERTTPASRAIGYGKAAMVFHMLRQKFGDELFFNALKEVYRKKKWKKTLWADFENTFQKLSKEDLRWFFNQWVERKGAPFIKLGKVSLKKDKIKFEIIQEGEPYNLEVPVLVKTADGTEKTIKAKISTPKKKFTLKVETKPVSIQIDPYNDIFRKLHRDEIPPTLSQVLGDTNQIIVLPGSANSEAVESYKNLAEILNRPGKARVIQDNEVEKQIIESNSIFILGGITENSLASKLLEFAEQEVSISYTGFTLMGKEYNDLGSALLAVFRNPYNREKAIAIFFSNEASGIIPAGRKLPHYGKYSYLAFIMGQNKAKGVWKVEKSPLIYYF
ncbi:MAG: M1 family metallopeptidase, partial [Fidelibacterota bacterium]